MVVADADGAKWEVKDGVAALTKGDRLTLVGTGGTAAGLKLDIVEGTRVVVRTTQDKAHLYRVGVWTGPAVDKAKGLAALAKLPPDAGLWTAAGEKPAAPRLGKEIVLAGERAKDTAAYVKDTIPIPFKNDENAWMRFGGFDFFSDGRAAVCTWSGDVWIVSGIDDDLEKVTWKRYAAGLFQRARAEDRQRRGLRARPRPDHAAARPQQRRRGRLLRVLQQRRAGHAATSTNSPSTCKPTRKGTSTSSRGARCGRAAAAGTRSCRTTAASSRCRKDGTKLEVVASGFRAPNGMGVGPNGEITSGDNEGTWTPMCPINWIKPGGFYGVPDFADKAEDDADRPRQPAVLAAAQRSRQLQRRPGLDHRRQVRPAVRPVVAHVLRHLHAFAVLKEEVGGQMQGGVVPLLKFDSGVCRARFSRSRMRCTSPACAAGRPTPPRTPASTASATPARQPTCRSDCTSSRGAVELTFSDPLDKKSAEDAG